MPLKQRHRERSAQVSVAILGIVAAAGIVAAVAVMPGVALALKPFARRYPSRQRDEVDRALRGLLRRGLVEEIPRGRTVQYQLTDRGHEYLMRCELAHAEFIPPKKWDGKWRLVVFDVPERFRHLRDNLRTHLTRLGLYPIQKSVWLFPYPCDDLVRLIKVDLGLGRSVQYFTTRSFEDREEEKLWRLRFDV
jgi:DNA-binding transcriptional regulator PaaX